MRRNAYLDQSVVAEDPKIKANWGILQYYESSAEMSEAKRNKELMTC